MQLEPVFEPFEQQFNLPTRSIELHHLLARLDLLGKGGAEDHHSRPPRWRQIGLGSLFVSKAFLLARTGLHSLLARQERNHQTHLKTLLVLAIPDPLPVLAHRAIPLVLDQSLHVNLLAIFSLQAHLVVAHPMHTIRSLGLSLLHTRSQLVACIGHGYIPFAQGKMMQSLGVVAICDLHLHQATRLHHARSDKHPTPTSVAHSPNCRKEYPHAAYTSSARSKSVTWASLRTRCHASALDSLLLPIAG